VKHIRVTMATAGASVLLVTSVVLMRSVAQAAAAEGEQPTTTAPATPTVRGAGADNRGDDERPRDDGRPWRFRGRGPMGEGGFAPGRGWNRAQEAERAPLPDDETWKTIAEFMQKNSPRRFETYKKQVTDEEKMNRLKSAIASRYKALEDLKQANPALYDIRLKRVAIEDQVFGLSSDLRHGEGEEKQVRTKLRQQVAALFASRLAEHKLLLSQLEQKVANEKKRVEDLQSRQEQLVQTAVQKLEDARRPGATAELFGSLFAPPGREPNRDRDRESPSTGDGGGAGASATPAPPEASDPADGGDQPVPK